MTVTTGLTGSSLTRLPEVDGPLPADEGSYPFSTMKRAVVPFDVRDFGYVEEEFFVSGVADVYGVVDGELAAVATGIQYVNRILVRRPQEPSAAAGTVWVDILNASNGFDVEDNWRRAWNYWMSQGHTYVGVTSKPLNVDALKNFDRQRYQPLNWDLDPAHPHEPVVADLPTWNPFQPVEGAEEGLVWDILGQTGALLRNDAGRRLLGTKARHIFLIGQSQSAVYLNTWISHFHDRARQTGGRPLFDGYLPSVGSVLERPLRQVSTAGAADSAFTTLPGQVDDVDVPVLTVSSEGDATLLASLSDRDLLQPGLADGPMRRHYQVAGTPHTDLRTPVLPQAKEIRRAGRLPRVMDGTFRERLNVVPLEPMITGAMAALQRWAADGVAAPPSAYLDSTDGRTPLRDARGNVSGGLRMGLVSHPLGCFAGAAPGDAVHGLMRLDPADDVWSVYPTEEDYRSACDRVDDQLEAAGYLEPVGRRLLHAIETELWQRATTGARALPTTPQHLSH